MRVEHLNFNKQLLVSKAFKNEETGETIYNNIVKFCGENFKVYDPNYCNGSIKGNCNILKSEELKVIDTFDIKYLENLEKEMSYLQKLINTRKTELLPMEIKTKLIVNRYKEGNKKLCSISIMQFNKQKDKYNDYIENNEKIIEEYKYNDTKPYKKDIDNKIIELKEKYNITTI
ncbi:TPA: hypothetical protein N2D16_002871 [Clostridium botulinum]|nr:hypothetical protein [Clostridium botulinum]